MTRRGLLVLLGAGAAGALGWGALPVLRGLLPPSLAFEPVPGVPGLRRLAGAETLTAAPDPLAGLGPRPAAGTAAVPAAADLCRALFDAPLRPDRVPVAFLTDIRCTTCRGLSALLADRALGPDATIALSVRDWPLLGEASVIGARATLAAAAQGAGLAMHLRLARSGLLPTPALLDRMAGDLGLDATRFRADMADAATGAALARTEALARALGLAGTPALVVGRTLVVGAIPAPLLDALVAKEAREGPPPFCAG